MTKQAISVKGIVAGLDDGWILEQYARATSDIIKGWQMVGLSKVAMSWVMYAYVSLSKTEGSYGYLVSRLSKTIRAKDKKLTPKQAVKLVELAIEERLTNKKMSGRLRGIVINVPQSTYNDNRNKYEGLILFVDSTLKRYEDEAKTVFRIKMGCKSGQF
ncbi:hypothetical protein EDB29_1011134 [Vibrio crassostreae]|uniref:hypothetical protein n=1 Tax=Vibrio crassostreae TaxID=246167 RepID=UPI0010539100|nr:hypothetical protein [Vibrio crassostreae]CAH6850307.1 conserved hypothetical protein [Vibrio chagasii]TCT44322.1 hypothetical protein EDB29_1011134 [Vibrio crassostreae]CAH6861685.1 conserved hypothetical protein [Vibrio chagasii]CAH6925379.1 conserved hypothetical protein [Vibrio chagasii]CAH6944285.1 conserved hypothetical protein [Vibrio chagasii]